MLLKKIIFVMPIVISGSDLLWNSKPIEMSVEFRNLSQKFAFIIAYKEMLYPLWSRTDDTISYTKIPIVFATNKKQEVPFFKINMYAGALDQMRTPVTTHCSIPRLSVIKVANPPGKEFVPRYLPIIYIDNYPDSSFPIQFSYELQDQVINYTLSFAV